MGGFRALSQLGLLSNVDALATVSGSSWFSSIWMFANGTDEELLGAPTKPSQLTLEALQQVPSKVGAAATATGNDVIMRLMLQGTPLPKLWQYTIGEIYLKPFGLDNKAAYLAGSPSDVERIKRNNPRLSEAMFYTPRSDRPSAYVILGTILAPRGYIDTAQNVVGLQISPDFTGAPFFPNASYCSYDPMPDLGQNLSQVTERRVGGGFVETFAFGGQAPKESPAEQLNAEEIEVGAPSLPLTLADAVGISSMAPAAKLAGSWFGLVADPMADYWPVTRPGWPTQTALRYEFGDGGNIDNSGLIPLLQRGVERVIWFAASYRLLNRKYPWESACAGLIKFDPVSSGVVDSFMDKFGYGEKFTTDQFYYLHNQVFSRKNASKYSCELYSLVSKGDPAVISINETVLPNAWWGITGGFQIEVVLVYLEQCQDFEKELPKDTKAELAKGANGTFAHFPSYKTNFQNFPDIIGYSAPQVNLLAAQAEYVVLRQQAKIRQVFGE